MRKTFITIFLTMAFSAGLTVSGQEPIPAGPDEVVEPFPGAVPDFAWRCEAGDTVLNFNAAVVLDSVHTLTFDSLRYARDYTLVAVYRPIDGGEVPLWRLDHGGGSRALTTLHVTVDSVSMTYRGRTDGGPAIGTVRQTAPDSTEPCVRLTLGGGGRVAMAEVMYFGRRMDGSSLRRVQGSLAARYGVTLDPVDYVDGAGRRFWAHADSGTYRHRVTCVGRDTTYGLNQLQSRSEEEGAMLTLSVDSLSEGAFVACGDGPHRIL